MKNFSWLLFLFLSSFVECYESKKAWNFQWKIHVDKGAAKFNFPSNFHSLAVVFHLKHRAPAVPKLADCKKFYKSQFRLEWIIEWSPEWSRLHWTKQVEATGMACQCGERGCWADKRKKFLRYQQRLERSLAIGKKWNKRVFPPFFLSSIMNGNLNKRLHSG